MNLPNIITICRLVLIPVFLILWWTNYFLSATFVFIIASATDLLDGHIARKNNQETKLGALLDPLVDKILVTTGLVMLVEMRIIPGWAVVLMLTREFLVTGLRTILIDKGIVLSAGRLGKLKTFLQILSICFLYFGLSLTQHHSSLDQPIQFTGLIIFWLAFGVTLASGVQYALKGKNLLESTQNIKPKKTEIIPDPLPKASSEILKEEGTAV